MIHRTPALWFRFTSLRRWPSALSGLGTQLRDNSNTLLASSQDLLKLKTLLASDSATDDALGKEVTLAA